MESLYVCLFSNGHIKVGRSIEPQSRIASHVERVSCMGIELVEHHIEECVGPAGPRELALIRRCTESAAACFKNEWFAGLDYPDVCAWVRECASLLLEDDYETESFGARLRGLRLSAGLTQTQLGKGLGFGGGDLLKAAISTWERNECSPNVNQLRLLCERLNVSADYLLGINQPA